LFRYEDGFLVNEQGKVMDVQGQLDTEGRHIAMSKRDGKISQQWDIVYVDRPFYIVSGLDAHRHLDEINNHNAVIKTRSNRNKQIFWFDQSTLTIRNKQTHYALNIKGNGGGP
jgi:hypothetical protein